MSDTKVTVYDVRFLYTNGSGGLLAGARVALTEGYTTFADIPKIIAVKRGWDEGDVTITSLTLDVEASDTHLPIYG